MWLYDSVVLAEAVGVYLSVGDARDLAHPIVGIRGVEDRGPAVVELVHRGDLGADVAEHLLAHAVSVDYRGAEPGLPAAIGAEVIRAVAALLHN
jgi:hypothetical protein